MKDGMKMKKSIGYFKLFIFLGVFLFMFAPTLFAGFFYSESGSNPFDYARITDIDYKAVLVDEPENSGKVIVTERLTFDIHAASRNNLFWELFRDLSEEDIDGIKLSYKVNSVKQILDNGTEIVFEESPKLYWDDYDYVNTNTTYGPGKWFHSPGPYNERMRRYECLLLYVDGLYREKVVFEIEYEVYNAALRYNDCSELYLPFYYGNSAKYLNSFKGQILIPEKDMPKEGNYNAYTYGTNSNSFPFTESKITNPGYNTFSFNLNKSQLKFKPYNQYLEFSLVAYGDDKHTFTENAPANRYSHENALSEIRSEQKQYEATPKIWGGVKVIAFAILIICAVFVVRHALFLDEKMNERHIFYAPANESDYFTEIPSDLDPSFAAELVFCKEKKPTNIEDGYAAIMLSLVRKDYIELNRINEHGDWNFENIKITTKYRPGPPPTKPETTFGQNPNIPPRMYSGVSSNSPNNNPQGVFIPDAGTQNIMSGNSFYEINNSDLKESFNQNPINPEVYEFVDSNPDIPDMKPLFGTKTDTITSADSGENFFQNQNQQNIDSQNLYRNQNLQNDENTFDTNQQDFFFQGRYTNSQENYKDRNVIDFDSQDAYDSYENIHNTNFQNNSNQGSFGQESFNQTNRENFESNLESLTPTEEQYFNLIRRHSRDYEIGMDMFQKKLTMDYENTNFFISNLQSVITTLGVKEGYFQKFDYKAPKTEVKNRAKMFVVVGILFILANIIFYNTRLDLIFGASFILGIGFILSARRLFKLADRYVLLTQLGEDEYVKWRGLYNYLNSDAHMSECTVTDLGIWEKYLIYATAFGVSESVIDALGISREYVGNSKITNNTYYRSRRYRSHRRHFRRATRSASSTARNGGYSGYGGGGRGRGGGGGGH